MTQRQRVGISEWRLAEAPAILVAYGLGSCLGIALYDPQRRLGALAHTLLPTLLPGLEGSRPGKFVDLALRSMVEKLEATGGLRERLVAKMVGGGQMFEALYSRDRDRIGLRNVRAARETLEALGIPLAGEETGGSSGRTMEFDLETGAVLVRTVRNNGKIITL